RSDVELLRSEMATKADLHLLRSDVELLRSEMATKADLQLLGSEVGTLRSDVELLRSEMAAQENRIVIKLGGLLITMIFLLLAIGPFYIRWVMSLLGSS
ncbi:MAG: hypothetical protein OXH77_00005, partial [Anaerolineaceae bacterium]|nr:hypothetical protein [Anaerolineaceae bacterium]